jgi:hypothetical protein
MAHYVHSMPLKVRPLHGGIVMVSQRGLGFAVSLNIFDRAAV